MCPEVRARKPGACPRCGMALEREMPLATTGREYTCPMHPADCSARPGQLPDLRHGAGAAHGQLRSEEENPELRDMTRRFWISVALTVPLLAIAMADMLPGMPVQQNLSARMVAMDRNVAGHAGSTCGAGWPFFQRGWASIVNRSTNMFTLIAMGTGVAYFYSLVATLFPANFPAILARDERNPAGLL